MVEVLVEPEAEVKGGDRLTCKESGMDSGERRVKVGPIGWFSFASSRMSEWLLEDRMVLKVDLCFIMQTKKCFQSKFLA